MRRLARALALLLAAAALRPASAEITSFVKTCGQRFVDGSGEWLPIGWNSWVDFNRAAAGAAQSATAPVSPAAGDVVAQAFATAEQAGFTAVRIFGHGEDPGFGLQTAPGQYSEGFFRGLDYILAQAAAHNIRVLFVPVNNWLAPGVPGGKEQYLAWAGLQPSSNSDQDNSPDEDAFWSNAKVLQLIKDHLAALTARKNVFTGRAYKDEPAIFAWDVYNEPRCPAAQASGKDCGGAVTAFYNELAAYLHSLDPNHLVTTGEEGFFALSSPYKDADPFGIPDNVVSSGRFWSGKVGQDFVPQHSSGALDFAVMHLWPTNWATPSDVFPTAWIAAHVNATRGLGKPLLLEEFGQKSEGGGSKTALYAAAMGALVESVRSGGPLRGALFWRWGIAGGAGDSNTVYTGDAIWQLLQTAVAQLKPYQGQPVSGCSSSPQAPPGASAG